MSFIGIKATKKRMLFVIIVVVLTISVLLAVLYMLRDACTVKYKSSEEYSRIFKDFLKTEKSFKVSDVFEFEFDRAYVVGDEIYADEEYFLETFNLDADVRVLCLETESINRILFVKDDTIVFVFYYDRYTDICPVKEGIWVLPDTNIIKFSDCEQFDVNTVTRFDFENTGDGTVCSGETKE